MVTDAPTLIEICENKGQQIVSGTAVGFENRGLLIIGASGSGKSSLALNLMAFGATLIGDDRAVLDFNPQSITLKPPTEIRGQIEARGLGILRADTTSADLIGVVDLNIIETDRLPPARSIEIAGREVPLLHKVESSYFASALWQYLRAGRIA